MLDWLAQLFVDFEPSIHYPQIQMHSGMVASPVLRLYNPVTQARELDPKGDFVRCWVGELREVPDSWIFLPWSMPTSARLRYGLVDGADYPLPLVQFEQAHRCVKADIAALRSSLDLQPAQGFKERPGRQALARRKEGPQRKEDADMPSQLTLF